jgi:hypothetical protein
MNIHTRVFTIPFQDREIVSEGKVPKMLDHEVLDAVVAPYV